ncbi:putative phage integrase [Photorhabdus temperata subsp. temperata M1021]|nr:putative phage integrase [Photorhabdus temperata subsp. temperata M1021]
MTEPSSHPDPRYRPPEPKIRLVPLLDATYVQRMRESFTVPVTHHTFRHSYAMHLAMSGYTRLFSLNVLAKRGLSFSFDALEAKQLLSSK